LCRNLRSCKTHNCSEIQNIFYSLDGEEPSMAGRKAYWLREVVLGRDSVMFHLSITYCYRCKGDFLLPFCLKIPPAEISKHEVHYWRCRKDKITSSSSGKQSHDWRIFLTRIPVAAWLEEMPLFSRYLHRISFFTFLRWRTDSAVGEFSTITRMRPVMPNLTM
jgi:hypothetical protein